MSGNKGRIRVHLLLENGKIACNVSLNSHYTKNIDEVSCRFCKNSLKDSTERRLCKHCNTSIDHTATCKEGMHLMCYRKMQRIAADFKKYSSVSNPRL